MVELISAKEEVRMQIALCSRSFESTISRGEMSFVDFLDQAKVHGIFAIDVLASHIPDLASAREIHGLLVRESIRVDNYSTRLTAISAHSGSLEPFDLEFEKA